MGTHLFQNEYIKHLLEKNNELSDRLAQMKENYENALTKKDSCKDFLASVVFEISKATAGLTEDVDTCAEKITDLISIFKNILLKKSEILMLVDKFSKMMNAPHNSSPEIVLKNESNVVKEQNLETKNGKKGGTLKVSPMINGHIILTEPKIYLSKISEEQTPTKRNAAHSLSPIMEESPNSSLNLLELANTKEARVSLERLNLNNLTSYIIYKDSPKSRFKKPRNWKNSLGNKQDIDTSVLNKGTESNKKAKTEIRNFQTETDPLEGPSWLYNGNSQNQSPSRCNFDKYVNCKRRRRFPLLLSQSEDSYYSDKSEDTKNDGDETTKSSAKKSPGESKRMSKKQNESPFDIISESFCETEKRNTILGYRLSANDRPVIVEESLDESESINESEAEGSEKRSSHCSKIKVCDSPDKSDLFYDTDNEEQSPRDPKNKSFRKRSSKFDSLPEKERVSNSKLSPVIVEQKESIKKKGKGSGRKNNETRESKSKRKKSDNRESRSHTKNAENIVDPSKNLNPVQNLKTSCGRTISESGSPEIFSTGSESRKKRRAAPNNLAEISLKVKLRRD